MYAQMYIFLIRCSLLTLKQLKLRDQFIETITIKLLRLYKK